MTLHSTLTAKGQTTIPAQVREALKLKAGDRLTYVVDGNHVEIRPQRALTSLAGALRSDKGVGMSIGEIRAAAAKVASQKRGKR